MEGKGVRIEMEGRGRMGEGMRAILLRKGKEGEGDRRKENGAKGFAGPMSNCFIRA